MIAPAREPSAAIAAIWPGRSISRSGDRVVSPAKRQVSHRPARPIGRLTRKIERQPTSVISAPPTNGPAVRARLAPAAQMADRAAARFLVGIGVAEQRQRIRHQDGGRQSLDAARGDQDRGGGRQRAGDRGRREDRKARHEYPLGADPVAERARRQDEGGKGDGVGAHHPLQFGDAAAERGSDA